MSRQGTLALLEEWLQAEISWRDRQAFREVVIEPLREVRRLRKRPAQGFSKDIYSSEFDETRKKLLWTVFKSLSDTGATFSRHPDAGAIKIPAWLDEGPIDIFWR